jgi:hypothetical protein
MVKIRSVHYYSCEKCGLEFKEDLKKAKAHELIPIDNSGEYNGIVIRNFASTNLFLHDITKLDHNHDTMYVKFTAANVGLNEKGYTFIKNSYSSKYEIERIYENRFTKEETLESGKKLWERVKDDYKNSEDENLFRLIKENKNLELKVLEQ